MKLARPPIPPKKGSPRLRLSATDGQASEGVAEGGDMLCQLFSVDKKNCSVIGEFFMLCTDKVFGT